MQLWTKQCSYSLVRSNGFNATNKDVLLTLQQYIGTSSSWSTDGQVFPTRDTAMYVSTQPFFVAEVFTRTPSSDCYSLAAVIQEESSG